MKKDRVFKAAMLIGLVIVMAMFSYVIYNIREVATNPCQVCMEKMPQVSCFPMVEGNLEPKDWPKWLRPVQKQNPS